LSKGKNWQERQHEVTNFVEISSNKGLDQGDRNNPEGEILPLSLFPLSASELVENFCRSGVKLPN
jgi:hypothetical protein